MSKKEEYERLIKECAQAESIVFGPWPGELGWELPRWIPTCRFIAKQCKGKKYAIGPRGHGFLYEFVDEYIPFDKDFIYDPCMHRVKPLTTNMGKLKEYEELANKLGKQVHPALVRAKAEYRIIGKRYTGTLQEKVKSLTNKPIICIFPRQRTHDAYRNWAMSKWVQVVATLCKRDYAVISFGGPEDKKLGYEHQNFFDFTEYNEEDQINLCVSALNLAKMGVAIQSGGFYLSLYACDKSMMFGLVKYVNRVRINNIIKSNYQFIANKEINFSAEHALRHIISYGNL